MEVNRAIAANINYRYKEFDSLSEVLTFTESDNETPAVDFTGCTFKLVIKKKQKTCKGSGALTYLDEIVLTEADGVIFNDAIVNEVKWEYLPGFEAGVYDLKFSATTVGGRRLTYVYGDIFVEK